MPVGKAFVNSVAAVLTEEPSTAATIRNRLVAVHSSRAVRYALKELVEAGRARRKGSTGMYVSYAKESE